MSRRNKTIYQDLAIEEIVAYLKLANSLHSPSTYTLMLEYGMPCYMGKRTFDYQRGTPRRCFMNAFKAVIADRTLTYVEGWCRAGFIPFEHAWCLDSKGYVIEPTLSDSTGYFGIPFQWNYIRRVAIETRVYGIISVTNPGLLTTPAEEFLAKPRRVRNNARMLASSGIDVRR